ncbi:hypothetical protein [Spirillospora sp. CA-294931]|uniref:hypothetical protein n=1 Tax=Spirillospora sp. CA-294931 TaxID=3240042 RepID=UPI003D936949
MTTWAKLGKAGAVTALALLLTGAPAAHARPGCPGLRGTASPVFDPAAFCRHLRSEFTANRPDLRRAFRPPARRQKQAKPQRPKLKAPKKAAPRKAPRKSVLKPGPRITVTATPRRPAPTPSWSPPPARAAAPRPDASVPPGTIPATVAVGLLLIAFVVNQRMRRPAPALPRATAVVPRPRAATVAPTAASAAFDLARSGGLGVIGPGTGGFLRAVLVELVTGDDPDATVVLSRDELRRLFDDKADEALIKSLGPRLQVCERLTDAARHLELEMLMDEAQRANPDLSPARGTGLPTAYWISAPGPDGDAVLPVLRQGAAHRLSGLVFGEWPHGRTCTVDESGTITLVHDPYGTREADLKVPSFTQHQALTHLRAHATADHTQR